MASAARRAFVAGLGLSLVNPKGYAAMAALFSGFVLVRERLALDVAREDGGADGDDRRGQRAWLLAGAMLTRFFRDPRSNRLDQCRLRRAAAGLGGAGVCLGPPDDPHGDGAGMAGLVDHGDARPARRRRASICVPSIGRPSISQRRLPLPPLAASGTASCARELEPGVGRRIGDARRAARLRRAGPSVRMRSGSSCATRRPSSRRPAAAARGCPRRAGGRTP